MHDTTLSAIQIEAVPVNEGDETVTLAIVTAIQLPLAGPDGQPILVPTGVYKVPMSKQAGQKVIESLRGEVEKLPEAKKPSGIVIPGSPQDAERIANDLGKFK